MKKIFLSLLLFCMFSQTSLIGQDGGSAAQSTEQSNPGGDGGGTPGGETSPSAPGSTPTPTPTPPNSNLNPGATYFNKIITVGSPAACVQIPGSVSTDLKSVTIEAWINNSSDLSGLQAIVSSTGIDFVHLQMSPNGGDKNVAYLVDGRTVELPVIQKLGSGWYHVAMVIASGNSRIYLNGEVLGQPNPLTWSGNIKSSNAIYIGKGMDGGRLFNGQIADVRIWKNKALSQAEIKSHIQSQPAKGLVYQLN